MRLSASTSAASRSSGLIVKRDATADADADADSDDVVTDTGTDDDDAGSLGVS